MLPENIVTEFASYFDRIIFAFLLISIVAFEIEMSEV